MNEQKKENKKEEKKEEKPKRAFLHFSGREFSWWETGLTVIGTALFIGLSVKATNKVCSVMGGFYGKLFSDDQGVIETAEYNEVPSENENVSQFKRAE